MNRKRFLTTLFAAPLAFCAAAVKAPPRRLGYRLICKLDDIPVLSHDGKRDLIYKLFKSDLGWYANGNSAKPHRIPL